MSVPIELTKATQGENKSHYSEFDKLCFGIIEKPRLDIHVKKEITYIKIKLQDGRVLIEGNPKDSLAYVANLDSTWSSTGSSNVKIELDHRSLYGSKLEIGYTLTIENCSEKSYKYANYYKYGIINDEDKEAKEAKVKIKTVLEYLDSSITIEKLDELPKSSSNISEIKNEYNSARKTLANNVKEDKGVDNKIEKDFTSVYELGTMKNSDIIGELSTNIDHYKDSSKADNESSKTSINIWAKKDIVNSTDDLDFISFSQISNIKINENTYSDITTEPNIRVKATEWNQQNIQIDRIPYDSAELTITPSTGLNKNLKYFVVYTICLSIIGAIIVLFKRV